MKSSAQALYDRQIAGWLLICAAVIFGMILLGGVTRLTNSGLSMVEWRPLMGVVPPLSEEAWQASFEKYKQFPEYRKVNLGMTLHEYKSIFMYEYLHRMLGRLIGVIFLLPMLYFAIRGRIRPGLMPKLLVLFFLGACQGLLGWYMVKSGLVDNPRVSQYRLTAHLGLAFAIYAYMVWLALDLLSPQGVAAGGALRRCAGWALGLVGVVYLMILSGGLVAGTRAGFAYSTWPLMGTSFIPPGLYAGTPAWLDAFEDITTIQFNHRMLAYLVFVLVMAFAAVVWQRTAERKIRVALALMVATLLLQVTLGISTLLLHVPLYLAAAHQGGAVLLLSATLYVAHALRRA